MKKLYTLLLAATPLLAAAQGTCNEAGNVLIYSNYDGGNLTISIDQDIPDIRIGICSYESVNISIEGPYVDNVTQVLYAGYDDDGTTSIDGVAAAITDVLLYPAATISDPDGYPFIICAYECDTDFVPGGCNTVEQVTDYFLTELGGTLRYSEMQYGVWSASGYDMSDGGNCCYGAPTECFIDIAVGKDPVICSGNSALLVASGADTYTWTPADGIICSGDCASATASPGATTTYVVMGTDADGCFGYDTITVYVNPTPVAAITVSNDTAFASGGVSYQWLLDGTLLPGETGTFIVAPETGNYQVIVTSAQGCSDTSALATVVVEQPQSLNNLSASIRCFPNPASDYVILSGVGLGAFDQWQMFNLQGQTVGGSRLLNPTTCYIHLTDFAPGMYLLELRSAAGSWMQHLVVE